VATLALTAALVFPLLGHSDAELAAWQSSWNDRLEANGGILDRNLIFEFTDMRSRHLCQLADVCPPPTVRAASGRAPGSTVYRGMGTDVEQWRPLVAAFFPADQVDGALRVMACESGGNPWADNPRSSAAGLFQFLRDTWNRVAVPLGYGDYDSGAVFDAAANTHAASVLSKSGSNWGPWSCGWAA
jgi:Lysozyme like domain